MSAINADSSELLRIKNNIQTSISSIEATKSSISRKCQQIGASWNDKKYSELENTVLECTKALNSTLKTLLTAQRYISQLTKSIQEYEAVQLGSGTVASDRSAAIFAENFSGTQFVKKKSDAEKLVDFKIGLSAINERISNYSDSLERRGMPRGIVMDTILNHQRNLEQAELMRNINGDFSNPVQQLDFDRIVESCTNSGIINYQAVRPQPRSLQTTRYGFTTQTINGVEMNVYNDPIGTNGLLIRQQGNSCYDMEGTCGLCQCSNLLTMAGVQGSTEDNIISAAMHCSDDIVNCMELFNSDTCERGGTTVHGRQEILSRCGLDTYCLPVSVDRNQTVSELSNAVRTGHGVIVSVDVARLWRNGQSGGHAISLISVTEDGSTFIYNDTGSGRLATISANELALALTGRPANITTNIIR